LFVFHNIIELNKTVFPDSKSSIDWDNKRKYKGSYHFVISLDDNISFRKRCVEKIDSKQMKWCPLLLGGNCTCSCAKLHPCAKTEGN